MKLTKFISIILLITLALSAAISIHADTNIYSGVFVALGDSIAYGYSLENKEEERYSTLVGKEIGAEVINHAVSGMTTDSLILALNSGAYDESLARANYVSISIGSNDLLSPFSNIITEILSTVNMNIDSITAVLKDPVIFNKINEALTDNEVLLKACEDFGGKLSSVVGILNKKAPRAELYFNNIYNPYQIVIKNPLTGDILLDFNGLGEYYINKINANFNQKSYDYTLIDIYTPFSAMGLTNVNLNLLDITATNMDPHPNAKGQQVIAEAILNIIGVMPRPVDIEGHWGEPYIMAMLHKGLFSEIIDHEFNPDTPMTRGMFVTILGRLLKVDTSIFTAFPFIDVTPKDYYKAYVAWAEYYKLVLGDTEKKFNPNQPITREEMAVILQRCVTTFELPLTPIAPETKPFNDADKISSWAKDAISLMQSAGLFKGDENNNVSPLNTITNAEVVTILYRFDDNIYNIKSEE